jgi:hypothetical protein
MNAFLLAHFLHYLLLFNCLPSEIVSSLIAYDLNFFLIFFLPVPMGHACNPSYTGGREQEGHSSKPAKARWGKQFMSLYLENIQHKKGLVDWFKV